MLDGDGRIEGLDSYGDMLTFLNGGWDISGDLVHNHQYY